LALAALVALAAPAPRAQSAASASPCAIETAERIVAIGDVHGAYDAFVTILREAGLVDGRARWTGGRATLVQLGDVVDRGADSRKVLDLLRRLEREAERGGGRVIALVGNHETMRMIGDFRDVSAGEYAAFRSPDSSGLRDAAYEVVLAENMARARAAKAEFDQGAFRKQFFDETPLGLVEMVRAFGPAGEYGEWLRRHHAIARINGIVFVHGGVSPAKAAQGCEGLNAAIRAEIDTVKLTDPNITETLVAGADGPLWYRGLVVEPTVTADEVDGILGALGARAMVVGHSVSPDRRIRSHFDGRIFQTDTGMLAGAFYSGGVPSALEIKDATFTAIYVGRREPVGKTGQRPEGKGN
jgi:hypothetical protein